MKLTLVWRESLCISAPSHSKLICDAMQWLKFHSCHCHSALTCRATNGFIQHRSNHGNVRVSSQKSVWQVGTIKLASFLKPSDI